jgi:phosphoribosylpyrophosphate synthetase
MASAAKYLLDHGAASVDAMFAHGPFEPDTGKNLSIFRRIWTSNSCPAHVPSEWVQVRF